MEPRANELGLGVAQLRAATVAATDLAPLQLLIEARLARAQSMLVETDLEVNVIARQGGFDDPSVTPLPPAELVMRALEQGYHGFEASWPDELAAQRTLATAVKSADAKLSLLVGSAESDRGISPKTRDGCATSQSVESGLDVLVDLHQSRVLYAAHATRCSVTPIFV